MPESIGGFSLRFDSVRRPDSRTHEKASPSPAGLFYCACIPCIIPPHLHPPNHLLMERTQEYLNARAKIALDLWKEGKITRSELHRLEIDALHGTDTGPVRYRPGYEPRPTAPRTAE